MLADMSNTAFPSDKEPGELLKRPIEQNTRHDNDDDSPKPSMRQIVFVLGLLWTSWSVGTIFDTMLEVEKAAWRRGPMSPLQSYVYTHNLDWWVYNVRIPYF